MKKIALAGLGIAALAFAPQAAADITGVAPFTGSWHAHASDSRSIATGPVG
jgi:hypothetical protein